MTTLQQALPQPIRFTGTSGKEFTFRCIGLDIWSEFCEWISSERKKEIQRLVIDDGSKASLFKDLVYSGVDTDDMLSQASTMRGMVWLVCRCCEDSISSEDLSRELKMISIGNLFRQIADMPKDDESGNVEAVGDESTGAS